VKWILLAGLLGVIPLLVALLRSQPRYLPHACFAMGLSVYFLDPNLAMAPISWPAWQGAVKGVEISLVDSIAIAILFVTRPVRIPGIIKLGFAIYVTAVAIAAAAGQLLLPSIFYAWQLARAVLVFVAVARATATNHGAPLALAAGLGSAILIQFVVAIRQFITGAASAGGTLGHQNMLGLASHFATLPAFALLLSGRRNLAGAAVVVAGAAIAFAGGSRATIGLLGIGLLITVLLSIRHHRTGRKLGFAVAAFAAIALATPAMIWSIERRPEAVRASSNKERQAFNEAAKMIIADHPLGVGGSQYVVVANVGGYLARAGAAWNYANRSAPVHNSYYLVAGEHGLLGLFGMIATLAAILMVGWRGLRHTVRSDRSELLVGLLGALIVVTIHIGYEWLFMHWLIHYLFAMTAGAMVAIAVADRAVAAPKRRLPTGAEPNRPAPQPAPLGS
jgi:hypothetical protein